METWRRLLPLASWLGALGVGLAVFHGLGSGPIAGPPLLEPSAWGDWAAERDTLVATVAMLRLVVLALAWYLVGVTTLGLVARLLRAARLVRLADALTVPMVRRLLQGALGVGLATAMVGAATMPGGVTPREVTSPTTMTAVAQTDAGDRASENEPAGEGQASVRSVVGTDGPIDGAGTPGEATLRALGPQDQAQVTQATMRALSDDEVTLRAVVQDVEQGPAAGPAASAALQADDGVTHEVREGESLWSIAQDRLVDVLDREPADAEILAYWEQVIEDNRASLADPDNPDLIFPGDEVALPDLER